MALDGIVISSLVDELDTNITGRSYHKDSPA